MPERRWDARRRAGDANRTGPIVRVCVRPLLLSLPLLLVLSAMPGALAYAAPRTAAELDFLLHQDCGSCHGLTLKGGLGSPLRAETMRERPDADLVEIILNGLPGTPMPPWRSLLTHEEALWIVQRLKAGPDESRTAGVP